MMDFNFKIEFLNIDKEKYMTKNQFLNALNSIGIKRKLTEEHKKTIKEFEEYKKARKEDSPYNWSLFVSACSPKYESDIIPENQFMIFLKNNMKITVEKFELFDYVVVIKEENKKTCIPYSEIIFLELIDENDNK